MTSWRSTTARAARLLTGLLSIRLCAGILGAQALAIGTVVNATIDLPTVPSILVGMGVVMLYSSFGGAWAVIQTDMLQFVFLGVFIPVTLMLALGAAAGPAGLVAALPEAHLSFGGGYGVAVFIGLFVSFLLGETLVPPYAQRTFSTPDSRHARLGFALSGGLRLPVLLHRRLDRAGRPRAVPRHRAGPGAAHRRDEPAPGRVDRARRAALLAVVMSTASSYLNSIAVVFVKDIYQPFVNPQVTAQAEAVARARAVARHRRGGHRVRPLRAVHRRRAAVLLLALGAHDRHPAARRGAVRRSLRARPRSPRSRWAASSRRSGPGAWTSRTA